jgi:hypothetical protein
VQKRNAVEEWLLPVGFKHNKGESFEGSQKSFLKGFRGYLAPGSSGSASRILATGVLTFTRIELCPLQDTLSWVGKVVSLRLQYQLFRNMKV